MIKLNKDTDDASVTGMCDTLKGSQVPLASRPLAAIC